MSPDQLEQQAKDLLILTGVRAETAERWLTSPTALLSGDVPLEVLASNPERGWNAVCREALYLNSSPEWREAAERAGLLTMKEAGNA